MPSPDELSQTLEARMEELLQDARTLDRSPSSTITPERSRPDAAGEHAIALLRRMGPTGAGLEVRGTIGEGGMGVVRLATQVALGREVAVKTLKADQKSDAATLKLLREAWVTGSLEHPNVVPVYDISLDAQGSPQIVLKKIGGAAWADLMRDDKAIRKRFQARDAFEWNVRILVAVCNAVHFAHSRGILHRDLKPENVMIGEFGEVYVLDWGIAVAMHDDGTGRLPLAKDAIEMAGTPLYMAPEMLGGAPGLLSQRTDVYLLGAMLFEVIAGRAPHEGAHLGEILHSIARSKPTLPEGTPAELARIVLRALDADPDARFESAEQLRLALIGFLEHRGSLKLAGEAEARLAELLEEKERVGGDPDERRLRLYHLFGECRFGFLEALEIWRDNEEARAGLRRALITMIELELEQGDPKAAALLLAEVEDAPAELIARVSDERAKWQAEEERRAKLARDHDPSIGRRTRVFIGVVLGTLWTIAPFALWVWTRTGHAERSHAQAMLATSALFVAAMGLGYWARDSLSRTAINRRLTRLVGIMLGSQILLFGSVWRLGVTPEQTGPLLMFLYTVLAAVAAATIESRLWPTVAVYVAGLALANVWPEHVFLLEAIANLSLTINVVVIWARIEEDVVAPLRERSEQRRREWQSFLERQRARESKPPGS
ncbi:serine/threonine-protein kinase [Sandaracinus amylolyticus]|uniref:serine/threonine-protein kinase n=1 Tax=Sandaracinus amylolyticus TaxID=927083 RepID=UPI001F434CC7|nr:serine/threonine-protein kinase [Sandaracinus amylolyticus]UJR83878.1 Hypothetical protein I5071_59490 [Sandaracinus amylolyticus]